MGPQGWPSGWGFDLDELMRMLQTPGPVNWELAQRVAAETSTTDRETHQPMIESPSTPPSATGSSTSSAPRRRTSPTRPA